MPWPSCSRPAARSACTVPTWKAGSITTAASRKPAPVFLLANPRNRLRILVGDSAQAVRNGHRLISLSRRLSSNCLIRRLNPDYPKEDDAFLLADDQGLLLRPKPAQPAGYACYRAAGRVRQLQARFEQAWDTSLSDPDLRSFLL